MANGLSREPVKSTEGQRSPAVGHLSSLLALGSHLALVPLLHQLLELLLVLLDALHQLADLFLAVPDQQLLLLDQ